MGAETIVKKINQKAAAEAEEIRAAGGERAKELQKKLLSAADEKAGRIMENAQKEADAIRHREKLNASLDARKNTLSEKRSLVDEVFERALDRLCDLENKEWEALMERLVMEECLPGKVKLHAAQRDIDRLGAPLLIKWSGALSLKYGSPCVLTLCREPAKFRGGLLFEGTNCDIDASFESLLRDLREAREQEVASLLFQNAE